MGEKREKETFQLSFFLQGHIMSCSIGSAFKSLTSIHLLCSPSEEASHPLKQAVLLFVSKPRGKIIMMKDTDVNNGMFLRLSDKRQLSGVEHGDSTD